MSQDPKSQPQQKPAWMSDHDWQEHLEELKAFEKRNFRHSGGRVTANPSKDSPEASN